MKMIFFWKVMNMPMKVIALLYFEEPPDGVQTLPM
jgi:hypothetical protein